MTKAQSAQASRTPKLLRAVVCSDLQTETPQSSLLAEVIKYSEKESDLNTDEEWFLELTPQLPQTKAIAVGGVLRDCMRQLATEPEQLVGKDNQGDVDERHLYFE
jgi:hypothetical protein